MNININQRFIKRVSRVNDIINCDWRDDVRNVIEYVEQVIGKIVDFFWRGICYYCLIQRFDVFIEEGQRYKVDDYLFNVDVVVEYYYYRQ